MITENYSETKQKNNAPGDTLGIVAGIASVSASELPKLTVWELQDLAAKLLPDEKISQCLRHRAPVNNTKDSPIWGTVEIHQDDDGGCHYDHLIICDRLWGCPICASRISESRRKVLTAALDQSGHHVALATFTLSHHKKDDLKTMLDAISEAYRTLKSGWWWQNFKAEHDWVGDIKALEVTYGENGWHPHIHALMLFDREIDEVTAGQIADKLKKQWLKSLKKHGKNADWLHGCDVRTGENDIRDYIAKFGRLPKEIDPDDRGWTVEHELTKGQTKQAREGGRTPWELLADYGRGDKRAGALFVEYYYAFKGRNQLVWSRGLKELLNVAEIEQQIEEEFAASDDTLVLEIYPMDWLKICCSRVRGQVLKMASEKPIVVVQKFIRDLPPPPE